jgi:leader peptidase (prepilin peptidase) / N-methyltransferase
VGGTRDAPTSATSSVDGTAKMTVVATPEESGLRTGFLTAVAVGGSFGGVLLAGAALVRFGVTAHGVLWAAAEILLVVLASIDLATRRVPNRVTVPAAVAVVVLRAAFVPSSLPEALGAGAAAFAFFLLVAVLTRGGMGMGDVKLAALIGLLLGRAALPALLLGIVAGGLASLVVIVARRGGRGYTLAYAPYLCLGAAIAIVAFNPHALV